MALRRTGDLVIHEIDAGLSDFAVNFLQLSMLVAIASGRAHSPAGIAQKLDVDRAVVTRALDKLEANHFVQRRRSVDDRRNVLVSLTEPGAISFNKLCNVASAILRARLGKVPSGECEHLQCLLALVRGVSNV
ncbi:hypothetical protein BTO02_09940 [Paraburkholderia sp. SOS3]|nr:hypothetical protein BTO02_09940 [Paraburkholderia sp. SOS3]